MTTGEYIRLTGDPITHAKAAVAAGHHIEALQVLHSWVESRLQELLLFQRTGSAAHDVDWGRAWDLSYELHLLPCAKALFVIGVIPLEMLGRIQEFNRVRNNLVHKLLLEPHEKDYPGVPRRNYESAIDAGSQLGEELQAMISGRLG